MPGYKCTKCDEGMHSKNPAIRSIFCNDQTATIMTNIVNVMTKMTLVAGVGRRVVTFEFPYCDTDDKWTDDELEMQCVQNIKHLTDDQIKHWLCEHDWELVSGEVTVRC